MLLAIIEQSCGHRRPAADCRERAADGCECAELPERADGRHRCPERHLRDGPGLLSGRTWQNNIAYERAVGTNYSASISAMYARGYSMPVISK